MKITVVQQQGTMFLCSKVTDDGGVYHLEDAMEVPNGFVDGYRYVPNPNFLRGEADCRVISLAGGDMGRTGAQLLAERYLDCITNIQKSEKFFIEHRLTVGKSTIKVMKESSEVTEEYNRLKKQRTEALKAQLDKLQD